MSQYFHIPPEATQLLTTFTQGKNVLDIGGYTGALGSLLLKDYAAKSVCSYDKSESTPSNTKGLTFKNGYFNALDRNWVSTFDAFTLSWPSNNNAVDCLPFKLPSQGQLLYIGTNFGGTACGSEGLWNYLSSLEVVAYISNPANSFIVYDLGQKRKDPVLLCEEYAALHQESILAYCEGYMATNFI